MTQPPEGEWPEQQPTVVQTAPPAPVAPQHRMVFEEGPPPRGWDSIAGWFLALLFLAAALILLFLWLHERDRRHSTASTVVVPGLVGKPETQAQQDAQSRGLNLTTVSHPSAEPAGTVLDQAPDQGARLERGARVMAVVSAGKGQVVIPDLKGMPKAAALAALKTAGLRAKTSEVAAGGKQAGTVLSQSPTSGENVAKGTVVALVVAKGKAGGTTTGQQVSVPTVVGMTEADAVTALQQAHLIPEVHQVASNQPRGQVTGQNPASGQQVAPNSKVTINVSNGPTPTTKTVSSVATATVQSVHTVTETRTVTRTETVTVTTSTQPPP